MKDRAYFLQRGVERVAGTNPETGFPGPAFVAEGVAAWDGFFVGSHKQTL